MLFLREISIYEKCQIKITHRNCAFLRNNLSFPFSQAFSACDYNIVFWTDEHAIPTHHPVILCHFLPLDYLSKVSLLPEMTNAQLVLPFCGSSLFPIPWLSFLNVCSLVDSDTWEWRLIVSSSDGCKDTHI